MLLQQKTGKLHDPRNTGNRELDFLCIEWFEAGKKILRKQTKSGRDISLKFLQQQKPLRQDEIIYEDDSVVIVIDIQPCDCLLVSPKNMFEMASACYEIGNKHLPLFFENNCLLVPADEPLFRLLQAQGYAIKKEWRKLLQPLNTTVTPHGHNGNETLFSKIMKMKNPA